MTIDEAIEHAEDVATKKRMQATDYMEYSKYDGRIWDNNIRKCEKCANEHKELAEWLEQLKEYQHLEEQGRLVKLPCKVGDVVYVTEPTLVEAMCVRIQLDGDRNGIWINAKEYPYDRWISFKAFGKTVFLTKSEAEAKLKELRGSNE